MWLILLPFHRRPRRCAAAGDDPRPTGSAVGRKRVAGRRAALAAAPAGAQLAAGAVPS
ncbi:hypothetical protein [Accumulibacter sp.]|uniref:hypothetical protein n=1 Tax=Accumulibacter sp. TaxID=2053492 RepID=UPI0035AE92B1